MGHAAGSAHIYAIVDPEYTNEKDEEEGILGMIKNHWALLTGESVLCSIFLADCLFAKYFVYMELIIISSASAVYSSIVYAFMTKNKESILARYLKPWNIAKNAERISV